MKLLTLVITLLFLSACSTQTRNSKTQKNKTRATSCNYSKAEITASGKLINSGYICNINDPITLFKINNCKIIKAYSRSNGVYVKTHKRCQYNFQTNMAYRSDHKNYRFKYHGPVYVRDYYRKNGTYVRPHTRRRPRRK